MAFYNNIPEKKKKSAHYEDKSWEDEGEYRQRKSKTGQSKNESRENAFKRTAKYSSDSSSKTTRSVRNPISEADNKGPENFTIAHHRSLGTEHALNEKNKSLYNKYEQFEYRPVNDDHDPSNTEETKTDNILCGRNPIREALKNNRDIEKLMVQAGELSGSAREIVQNAKEKRIPVQIVEKSRLDEIASHHQGLIAFASAYHYSTLEDIIHSAEEKHEKPFLIILDGITDPHNLGAIIRTAECAGAHGVIVPERRSVGLTPAAVKASAGAVEHVPVARVTNLNRTIKELKKTNIWTYAVTMKGQDYDNVSFDGGGIALVIGSEGEGISHLVEEECDFSVSIPMKGKISSLNASVAAGIIMYRVFECKRK